MILICRLLIAMLCLSSIVLGQGGSSIQTGYVAVIPVVGFGDGLTVLGRIAHQADGVSFHGTIWSGAGVIRASLIVSSDRLSGVDTGIALVNPNDFAADITLTLRRENGQIVATRIITLERRRQISRFISEIFSLQQEIVFTGFLSISSTVPLGIAGLSFQGPAFSAVPNTGPVWHPGSAAASLCDRRRMVDQCCNRQYGIGNTGCSSGFLQPKWHDHQETQQRHCACCWRGRGFGQ